MTEGRPLDVLEATIGETVAVRLKDGEIYTGSLAGYDQHMNVVLEPASGDAEPPTPGEVGVETVESTTIIRGDNVVTITP